MSSYDSSDGDMEVMLFDMTDIINSNEDSSEHSETESARYASDERDEESEGEADKERRKQFLSLRQRRLSKALASFEGVKVNINAAQRNWIRAIRKARNMDDPWEKFHLDDYKTEICFRHRYNALKKAWVTDEVKVKMEKKPFNKGAMRECFRLKKLSAYAGAENWNHTHNFVAKSYMETVERDVYFQDVKLQMDAKLWGEEYSRHNPPKKVDIFQMYILEFKDRPDSPLYHCEHFIEGEYIKYNSNSGFVDSHLRNTPQAFSHFTFERSGHQLIVVDIQGVGDLYTDPQIHSIDGKEYGDGNLGAKGMALFFYSHVCNDICHSLGLSEFDLSEQELSLHKDQTKMQRVLACTVARGKEELCMSPNIMSETINVKDLLKRQRSYSSNASDSGFDGVMSPSYEEPMMLGCSPITSPGQFLRSRNRYSESENSVTSQQEDDIRNFQMKMQQLHRPSCVALEKDLRKHNFNARFNDSALGKVHHEMAKYHELGRFCSEPGSEDIDWDSAIFHEIHAAELGELEAILTVAKLYLGMERAVLVNCTVGDDEENTDTGMDYMVLAADAGDRSAMLYVAKAFETGNGLGKRRGKSWEDALHWFDEALNVEHDEGGEFDSTMDDPPYMIMARMAAMYREGGFGLEKMPERAAEMYNDAAEKAMESMKGRLANKYYCLSEECYGEMEEEE